MMRNLSYVTVFLGIVCCRSSASVHHSSVSNVIGGSSAGNNGTINASLQPETLQLYEGERKDISVVLQINSSVTVDNWGSQVTVTADSEDPDLFVVHGDRTLVKKVDGRLQVNATIEGVFLGRSTISFTICIDDQTNEECMHVSYPVAILRAPSVLRTMFPVLIVAIVSINYINMGCQIDIGSVWKKLKTPLAPLVGCFCQFLFMPLVSYGIGLLLLKSAVLRFGFFLLGCSPGGNSSNLWTLLLDGDVTLSIAMTFVSTVASIGMMPLWTFILGRHIAPETGSFKIPFSNIAGSLAALAIPIGVGMLIRRLKPDWAEKSKRYIKATTLVILVFILVISCTVNRYIFLLMTWQTFLSGALVSWSAYIFGALAALVVRLKKPQVIALAIEVAFQNGGIATVILYTSLPEPDSDIVIVPVVCQIILQGVPLYVLLLVLKIRNAIRVRWGGKEEEKQADELKPLPPDNCGCGKTATERNDDVEKADEKLNDESGRDDDVDGNAPRKT
ncbi:ileal sodium/bile acid cotransporter-like [Ornithodoros turicata]|uniref:ileal sodium/bile acid cotransporter-like n=1 Tax=Ornithodoros turicata TaxID=34597 RepID=UPI0031393926